MTEPAPGILYLDASALVKLVLPEPETPALAALLPDWPWRVSSALATVEVVRAAQRASPADDVRVRAEQVVGAVGLIPVDVDILRRARALPPPELRSLAAVHLATALCLGRDLGALAAYDERLAEAARREGIAVLAPG